MFDIILRRGRIVDGSGLPWYTADVGILGDRIAAIGQLNNAVASTTIDASGLVIAPGFIDAHVHGDLPLMVDPYHEPSVRQGVTTHVVGQDGVPVMDDHGHPELVMAAVRADEATFLDNWHVLGMRGTDSCDVEIKDVFVPQAMSWKLMEMQCVYDIPAAYLPLRVVLSFPHCAVALGIARGAIDDMVELGKTKRASMNPAQLMGDDPVFRHEFGQQMLHYEAASAMLWQWVDRIWQAGVDQREPSQEEVLTARLMANHITSECVKIVDWAYTRAGSTPVYDGSSLQTRFRDIHVATQHASCHTDAYRHLGAAMLGEQLTARELF
jgi:alkylation response protein AidB-like acyl-CoA dehydrogenase